MKHSQGIKFVFLLMAIGATLLFARMIHRSEREYEIDKADFLGFAIRRIQNSPLSEKSLLLRTASESVDNNFIQLENCYWYLRPKWGSRSGDPNWFLYSKKFDQADVICDTHAAEEDGSKTEFAFSWNVTRQGAVTSFSFNSSDLQDSP